MNLQTSTVIPTVEFLLAEFSVNSILYQRGVYPPEKFTHVQKYGMTVLVTDDDELRNYLEGVTKQLKELLLKKLIEKLVLVSF